MCVIGGHSASASTPMPSIRRTKGGVASALAQSTSSQWQSVYTRMYSTYVQDTLSSKFGILGIFDDKNLPENIDSGLNFKFRTKKIGHFCICFKYSSFFQSTPQRHKLQS
jgi:hypothetical protein